LQILLSAHEIRLEGKNAEGVSVVSVKGDLIERDIKRIADVTKDLGNAIISVSIRPRVSGALRPRP
jgi:hypothetical protein